MSKPTPDPIVDPALAFDELPADLQEVLADWPAQRAVSRKERAMTNPVNATKTTVDWGQLHEELARPFPDTVIKYRVGAVSRDKKKAQALAFVPVRIYEDRLNELVPGAWSVAYEPWGADRIICTLTIHGVTRSSTGDGAGSPDQVASTAAEARAFKRACTKYGLGRHLYDMPAPWLPYDAESKTIRPPRPARPPAPAAAQPRPQAPVSAASPSPDVSDTLGRSRAATMHRELARLGLGRSEHLDFARRVLGHEVSDFAGLNDEQAQHVWTALRSLSRKGLHRVGGEVV